MLRQFCILFSLLVAGISINQPTNFDYDQNGDNWGGDCTKNSTQQSPIELSSNQIIIGEASSYFFTDFSPTSGVANYLNTTIYLNTSSQFGYTYTQLINGSPVPFKATQIRFRSHSEHIIDNNSFSLEVQIFHTQLYTTPRNNKLAIGLLFEANGDTPDPFIQSVIDGYVEGTKSSNISFDLSYLLQKNNSDDFWFYLGSTTIPSCSNGRLNWVVRKKIFKITEEQDKKMKEILSQGNEDWKGNWRKTQPINGNTIGFNHINQIKQF